LLFGQKNKTYIHYNQTSIQQYKPINGIVELTIYNNQIQPVPSGFQQDIAICNGSINLGNTFYHVDNVSLFMGINPNGQNVYFFTNLSDPIGSLLYSWYEGILSYPSMTCYVWWVKLPDGIPANSNITIYMYVGNSSDNFYFQYYPYVGANPYVIQGYDNGRRVFSYYWTFRDFNNPSLFKTIGKIYNSSNYIYLNSSKTSGIYTYNAFNLSSYIVDFYLSLPPQAMVKFGIGNIINISCTSSGIYYCTNLSLYNSLSYMIDGNSSADFYYNANIPTIYSLGYDDYVSIFLNNYYQMVSRSQTPKIKDSYIFVLGQNVTNLQIYWIRVRIMPPFENMPKVYITRLIE
jgi:hypothetical protein